MDNTPAYLFKLQISLLLPLYYTPRFKAVPIHKCKLAMDVEDNVIGVKDQSRGKWAAGIQANSPAAPIGEVPEAEVAFPGEDGIPDVQDHPVLVISSGGSMLLGDTVKTATASRSREIFLGLGNTGLRPSAALQLPPLRGGSIPRPLAAAVWPKRIESNFSRCAATHPPEGKGITAFSVACGSLQHGYQRLTTI